MVDNIRDDDVSKDEYQLALEDNVEDETLLEDPGVRKFSISSYGADYTVDGLVKRMRAGAFKIPVFQRKFVWTLKHSSKFIESLLMGLPVPGVFLYKEAKTNEHLVIDGQQRLRTLQAFYDGLFEEKAFRLTGVRDPWLNKTYKELEPADVLKLDDSVVHATIFKQDHPEDVQDSIYFVFERINSGGIRLSPQEIRNCVNLGPFILMVRGLNKNSSWRKVFGPANKRSKDEELIVRFLSLYANWAHYARPMNSFLNTFTARMNRADKETLDTMATTFIKTIEKVDAALGTRAFRLVRALNAAVFDSTMVGLAGRLKSEPQPANEAVSAAYFELLQNETYRRLCERATADEDNVRSRINLATEAFAKI